MADSVLSVATPVEEGCGSTRSVEEKTDFTSSSVVIIATE